MTLRWVVRIIPRLSWQSYWYQKDFCSKLTPTLAGRLKFNCLGVQACSSSLLVGLKTDTRHRPHWAAVVKMIKITLKRHWNPSQPAPGIVQQTCFCNRGLHQLWHGKGDDGDQDDHGKGDDSNYAGEAWWPQLDLTLARDFATYTALHSNSQVKMLIAMLILCRSSLTMVRTIQSLSVKEGERLWILNFKIPGTERQPTVGIPECKSREARWDSCCCLIFMCDGYKIWTQRWGLAGGVVRQLHKDLSNNLEYSENFSRSWNGTEIFVCQECNCWYL